MDDLGCCKLWWQLSQDQDSEEGRREAAAWQTDDGRRSRGLKYERIIWRKKQHGRRREGETEQEEVERERRIRRKKKERRLRRKRVEV